MPAETTRAHGDINAIVAGRLRDLAFAQSVQQKMFGYKRASAAILALWFFCSFEDARVALEQLKTGSHFGKIVIAW